MHFVFDYVKEKKHYIVILCPVAGVQGHTLTFQNYHAYKGFIDTMLESWTPTISDA